MTQHDLLRKIKLLKPVYEKEGFVIDGIFGSYARGEQTPQSDVDILYHLKQPFFEKSQGFLGFKKLDDIKQNISKVLGIDVDIAPKNNLSRSGKKHIMRDILYV